MKQHLRKYVKHFKIIGMKTFNEKADSLVKKFLPLTAEERYNALIEMGRSLSLFPDALKTPDRKVHGCQSTLYLNFQLQNGLVTFQAHADALISAGLAAVLLHVYNNESPETILKAPPTFIDQMGISTSLSMNRSNGLYHIHLKMKQFALQSLVMR
jgi:cysteine desulfuration protein SufE